MSLALKSSWSAVSRSRHCWLCPTADMSAVSHSRNVCVSRSTHVRCDTESMFAVSNSRHVSCQTADTSTLSHCRHPCCATQQAWRQCDTADISVVWYSMTHLLCQQTCLLCHTGNMSGVSDSRHVCCVLQQTRLLFHAADISAASHSSNVCCVP